MKWKKQIPQRVGAVMLATAVAGQTFLFTPAYAAETGQAAGTGSLDIDLRLELPTKGKQFTIALKQGETQVFSQSATPNDTGTQLSVLKKALDPGAYQLEIQAEGYLPYTQEVTIAAGMTTKLELYNNSQVNANQSGAKRGIMAVGDVNSDGVIDKADAEAMMAAIDAGSTDKKYDLNGDSKVNVADLTYITLNYGENVTATPMSLLSADYITPAAGTGTKVQQGKTDDLLLSKDTFVRFAAENGNDISASNPVELSLTVSSEGQKPTVDGLIITPPADTENRITNAEIIVEDAQGQKHTVTFGAATPALLSASPVAAQASATQESDGTIVVKLGQQIAVKKVTIRVLGASTKLVDIAQVEFVNGMEDRIPEPTLYTPTNVTLTQVSAGNNPSFSVSWEKQVNVTGYEVRVTSEDGKEVVTATTATTLAVSSLDGKLTSYTPYTVQVRSTSGQWNSPYSEAQTIEIRPESAPPAPENVAATGKTESVLVTWKEMRDTKSYSVHYRASGESEYQAVSNLTGSSYTLTGLKPNLKYEVYVVGHNELGASPNSEVKQATTLAAAALAMPKYKLINTATGVGQPTAGIIDNVELNGFSADDPFDIVDNNASTYATANSWDTGGYNVGRGGPIITLAQEHQIDTIRFAAQANQGRYGYIRVYTWDANDKETTAVSNYKTIAGTILHKADANGNAYYELKFDAPLSVKKLQLCLANGTASGNNTISEVAFYTYDSLEDDIEAVFTDATHIALADGVNKDTLDALQTRLDTTDAVSGEYHPDRASLQLVLNDAVALLDGTLDTTVIPVSNQVTAKADGHLDFAYTLSDLQPLGRTVQAGETINVYVGAEGKVTGDAVNLSLVFTQVHGEWSQWQSEVTLKAGKNAIVVPDIAKRTDENGGAVYVRYTGDAGKEQYNIRISGGESIPVLDISGKTGTDRTDAIAAYVTALQSHVESLESKHTAAKTAEGSVHTGDYNKTTCVLNFTDIVMDGMMYSFPASAVWEAIKGAADPAAKLTQALEAMEQEVELLYQHKGLNAANASNSTDRYPTQRLNIRYSKMFDGAFMYAGGKHIGIEFGSVGGLFGLTPVTTDATGNKTSGNLSGWGIGHEIGHVINNKQYATAEITNNYYAILATGDTRSDYNKVYQAVTSGGTSDGATALAMYWQLHMYYDPYGDYKTFDTAAEQLDNLFFARMDSYARKTDSAPKPGGVALTLSNSKSDNLIRLACAAAKQNLLSFFEAWGLTYDATTAAYAKQFTKAAPAVQYMSPAAQQYKLNGSTGMAAGTKVNASLTYSSSGQNSNKVTLTLSHTGDDDAMLGYEIWRNGEAVAFVTADKTSYTDTITTGNNRVYHYEVVAYDKLLNETEATKLDPVKVTHDGTLGRDKWTVTTNMTSTDDQNITADENNGYCEDTTLSSITNVIDGTGSYTGQVTGAACPEIVLKLGESNQVTALRYQGDAQNLRISVSADGQSWETVREVTAGELSTGSSNLLVNSDGSCTLYFVNPTAGSNLYVCQAEYVKVEMPNVGKNTEVTIQNIELLGPVGDNVEWNTSGSIGKLKEDYTYAEGQLIPAGSLVFTGTYKGNPAYNVVLLKDAEGNVVGGTDADGAIKAQQVILAEPLADGHKLGDIAEGTWIYWIEPNDIPDTLPGEVMAELYRVDDATTLEGERLVSETLYQTVPVADNLPELELQGGSTAANEPETNASPSDEPAVHQLSARTVSVQSQTQGDVQFILTHTTADQKQAKLALKLGDETAEATIAMQAAFDVTEGVNEVSMVWGQAMKQYVLLQECRFNPETRVVTIYVTAKADLLQNGQLDLGVLSMTSAQGTKTATLTLKPGSVVTVGSDYAVTEQANLTGSILLSTTEQAGTTNPGSGSTSTPSGGGGGGSGSSTSDKQHTVSVKDSANGSVSLSSTNVKKGSTVTITVKPETGYTLQALVVTDETGTQIALTDKGDGTYTFQMPDTQVSVQASFQAEESTAPVSFDDVTEKDYYYDAVQWAVKNGVTQGTSAKTFSPKNPCTRAETVTFLWRAAGSPEVEQEIQFTDVPQDAYYAKAVAWAVKEGITTGTSATTFHPDATVTRAQTVTFQWRAKGQPEAEGGSFADVKDKAYYAPAVAWAVQQQITLGTGQNTFSPEKACSRGEIVTFLYRDSVQSEQS